MSSKLGDAQNGKANEAARWRLLVVSLNDAVHAATEKTIGSTCIAGRPVAVASAHSLDEARRLLAEPSDIAVVLTDGIGHDQLTAGAARVIPYPSLDPTASLIAAVSRAVADYQEISALIAANERLNCLLAERTRELTEANLILDRLATTDPLTGIVNRRRFMDLASREVLRSKRTGAAISVILLDIDHLRQINDRHGQASGDAVLLEVVNRVGQALRTLDVLGRMGGEEFAILLPDSGVEGAHVVAERLRESVSASPMYAGDGDIIVTASLGVAALSGDEALDGLLHRADTALAAAKHGGRNQVIVAH